RFLGGNVGMLGKRKGDVLLDGHRVEQSAELEEHAESPANINQIALRLVVDAPTVEINLAAVRPHEGQHVLDYDAFSPARFSRDRLSDDHRSLAARQGEVDLVEHHQRAEALGNLA